MKTVKIYAVVSSQGSYDDYCECVEKCFTNIADAEKYVKKIFRVAPHPTPEAFRTPCTLVSY